MYAGTSLPLNSGKKSKVTSLPLNSGVCRDKFTFEQRKEK